MPLAVTGRYLPALDGLRGLAMVAVLLYHLDFSWASGFYLSIDLFFVLSGFLITSLLLEEWALTGRLSLGGFYARRARRLLPALFLALTLIALYVVLDGRFGPPGSTALIDLSQLRGDALATLFYVANWHAIFANESYWAQYAAQSPLKHTWTLAIEEQFYLVWPPILLGLLLVARKFGGHWRRLGVGVAVVGTVASATVMSVLFRAPDPSRVYYGTDSRAFDLFAGIAVAMVAAGRPQPGPRGRRALHVVGPLAAVALAAFWALSAQPGTGGQARTWMYHGGFLVCAGLAGLVIADVRQVHRDLLGRALSFPPLVWLGMISYGLYLFHWPVIIFLTTERTGLSGLGLTAARIGVTLALAAASFYLVEKPLRRAKLTGWRRVALGPAAAITTAVIIVMATLPAVAAPGGPGVGAGAAETTDVPGSGGFNHEVPITAAPGSAHLGRPPAAGHAHRGLGDVRRRPGHRPVPRGHPPGGGHRPGLRGLRSLPGPELAQPLPPGHGPGPPRDDPGHLELGRLVGPGPSRQLSSHAGAVHPAPPDPGQRGSRRHLRPVPPVGPLFQLPARCRPGLPLPSARAGGVGRRGAQSCPRSSRARSCTCRWPRQSSSTGTSASGCPRWVGRTPKRASGSGCA